MFQLSKFIYFLFNSLVFDRQRPGNGQTLLVRAQRLGLRCANPHCKIFTKIYCSKCVNEQVLQHIRITSSSKVAGKAVLGVSVTGWSSTNQKDRHHPYHHHRNHHSTLCFSGEPALQVLKDSRDWPLGVNST